MKNRGQKKQNEEKLRGKLVVSCGNLKKANKKLKEMDKEKSEFIAVASHQLRTPLSGIKWCLEVLLFSDLGKNMTAKQQNFLKQIYQNNQRLIELADNLLKVCKIEQGRVEIKARPVSLEEIIGHSISKLSHKIGEKKINVLFEKSTRTFPKVLADKEKIERVLMNILDNAIVYNYAGGRIIIILDIVSSGKNHSGKKYARCSVFNTGVGIPNGQLKRIFSKFFRANNVITVYTTGNGLDMFVSKAYIESHKGKIWAESEGEGRGATFHFTLPLARK